MNFTKFWYHVLTFVALDILISVIIYKECFNLLGIIWRNRDTEIHLPHFPICLPMIWTYITLSPFLHNNILLIILIHLKMLQFSSYEDGFVCAYNFKVNACKYFQNSVDLNNQNNIFFNGLEKSYWFFCVCLFIGDRDEYREQQRHEHNEFFHMFNKELHLKML